VYKHLETALQHEHYLGTYLCKRGLSLPEVAGICLANAFTTIILSKNTTIRYPISHCFVTSMPIAFQT
jgi:hypothetical protein